MHYQTLRRRVGNALRLTEVTQVLVRHGFADLLVRMGFEEIPARILRSLHLRDAPPPERQTMGARLRAALTELGPSFVKIGQVLSTRPDLLGMDLCRELGLLQDQVTPLPFDKIRPSLEAALGGSVEELFESFDTEPVAAASLSQVYKARLISKQIVAVKVQKPDLRPVIEADLNLLRAIAEWAAEHLEESAWMDPVGVVDEFDRSIRRELDFGIEARIIDQFHRNFADEGYVCIPRTYPGLCAQNVLTMDWVDGVRVDAIDEYAERGCDPCVTAKNGCEAICKQVFTDRLFHADPHPGNIMITRGNQLAFLDYGMVGHLERTDVGAMADLLQAIFIEDTSACVQALLQFTVSPEIEDIEALSHEIAEYLAFEAPAIISGGMVGCAIERVTAILRRHHLQLAPRFSLLLKALGTIEQTGHALDPNLDMITIIKPHVEGILTERYAPLTMARETRRDLGGLLKLVRQFPNDMRQLLRMLRKGRFQIHLQHEKLGNLTAVLDRASNRITVGLVTGSLIVGSSMLIATNSGAWHLGVAGYTIAGMLGLALVFSIFRSRNY